MPANYYRVAEGELMQRHLSTAGAYVIAASWINLHARAKKGAVRQVRPTSRGFVRLSGWPLSLRTIRRSLMALVAAGFIVALYSGLQLLRQIPVGDVQVYGFSGSLESNRGAREADLLDLVTPFLGRGFWDVELAALQVALESHPWVRKANIRRRWPNILQVDIDEHVPIARWNSTQLLATSGELFAVSEAAIFSSLPQITSPQQLGEIVSVKPLVDQFNSLQKLLKPEGQAISEYGIGVGSEHWLILRSGARIELGRVEHVPRLLRLIALVENGSINSWEEIAVVDLRYRSGFSVSWSDEYLLGDDFIVENYDSIESLATISGR